MPFRIGMVASCPSGPWRDLSSRQTTRPNSNFLLTLLTLLLTFFCIMSFINIMIQG